MILYPKLGQKSAKKDVIGYILIVFFKYTHTFGIFVGILFENDAFLPNFLFSTKKNLLFGAHFAKVRVNPPKTKAFRWAKAPLPR